MAPRLAARTTVLILCLATALLAVPGAAHGARPESRLVPRTPAAGASAGPGLTIDLAGGHPAISPLVYGVNQADQKFARAVRLPVDRFGSETYNWQLHASNTGADYFFENVADCYLASVDHCSAGASSNAAETRIALDRQVGATTLLTLPELGYVAKDAPTAHPFTCGYPASSNPDQDAFDPYDSNCGNGRHQGAWLPADPTRAGVTAPASSSGAWVKHLVAKYHDARHGGVGIYGLGNEPSLWDQTWEAFHPDATTYDEEWSKARGLALAVKAADPSAATLGPSEWGWPNYSCSAADDPEEDGCQASDVDRAAHGGIGLSQWYLQQFAAYQKAHGKRLLDYFDLHYYPAGHDAAHPYDVTRSLWDKTYVDPSYVGTAIRLIPRMRDWVHGSYPGTKTSLSAYNLGGDPELTARQRTLIEADALGIFGQQHLDLATFASQGGSPIPTAAFTIFRNYDGHGAGFGSRLVSATSGDRGRLAVYAARRGLHGALTIVVINKTSATLRSKVTVRHEGDGKKSKRAPVFRYTGGTVHRSGSVVLTGTGFTAGFPAQSITLIAIPVTG